MYKRPLYVLMFFVVFSMTAQNQSFNKMLDSIQQLRALSDNTDLDFEERLVFAKRASELSLKTGVDSIILLSDRKVAFIYLNMDNHNKVREWNHRNLKLAHKLKDSLVMAYANHNLGWYHHIKSQNDSAYYYYNKATGLYHNLKDVRNEVETLLNIVALLRSAKSLVEAETFAVKGLELLQTLPKTENNLETSWEIYNNMGNISKNLQLYDKALGYYKKALAISNKLSDNYESNLYININIAELYREKKEYDTSITIYHQLLKDKSIFKKDPITYAAILNNLAYARFHVKNSNHKEILSLFKRAYKISDSLNFQYEIAAAGNDMSELYLSLGQKDSTLHYLHRSYKVAKQSKRNTEVLRSLKLLSQAKAGEAGKVHLYEYIKLNDSILAKERSMRNKFARIQFETNEIKAENKKVTKDRLLLFIATMALLTSLLLMYLNFIQRTKNKALVFEKEQQKTNETIYALMLKQQTKLEEGRIKERYRISEELHDGILSKLFGIRVGFGYLSTKIKADDSDLQQFNENINNMQAVEREIRDVSHELKNDLLASRADFVAIIDHYVKDLSGLHLFDYSIHTDKQINWEGIDDKLKVNLYRVIQETLQNSIKHAQANIIEIHFSLQKETLILSIIDDGIGFDPKQQHKGIGLKNIRSRAQMLGGKLIVKSSPNNGTCISVIMPV